MNIMTEIMNNELRTAMLEQEILSQKQRNLDEIELQSEKYKQSYSTLFKDIKKSSDALLKKDYIETLKQKYDLFLLESFLTFWLHSELQKVLDIELSFVLAAIATNKKDIFDSSIKRIKARNQARKLYTEYSDEIKEITLKVIIEYLSANKIILKTNDYYVQALHDALV